MLQEKGDDTLAILHQDNVWICDTGASMHVTWNNKGARNVHDMMMYTLGHAGSAMESNALLDIPEVFVNKDGEAEVQAVLKDCSFNAKHNFNLVSMSSYCISKGGKLFMAMRP